MKRKVLSLLLVMCLLIGVLPITAYGANATSGTCGENVTWNIDTSTGVMTINGTGSMKNYLYYFSEEPAPWYALRNTVKTVIISEGITSVGSYVFDGFKKLTSVTLPNSIETIGDSAFAGCTSLPSITLGNNVTRIDQYAFIGCDSLTFVHIPSGVTTLGVASYLDDGEGSAFGYCEQLQEISVDANNPAFASVDGVLYDKAKTKLVQYPAGRTGAFTIPEGVTSVGKDAFYGCKRLTAVHIPSSVTSLGESGSPFIVYLPENPTAFSTGCDNLKAFFVDVGNPEYTSIDGVLYRKNPLSLVQFPVAKATTYTIPSGVTAIEHEACYRASLTEVTIPKSVEVISRFSVFPNGVTIRGEKGSYAETYAKNNNISFVAIAAEPLPTQFSDVKKDDYFCDAVKWAVANGVTTGMTETTFAPTNTCTRAQAVTFLWRAAGKPEPKSASNPFTDVVNTNNTSWYYKAVLWAVEQGITTGTTATTFSPNDTCNRAQIVTFLYRHAGEPAANGGTFSDVTADQYYYQAVQWATGKNITNGMGDGKFAPGTDCSRGHIVTFLYRALASQSKPTPAPVVPEAPSGSWTRPDDWDPLDAPEDPGQKIPNAY